MTPTDLDLAVQTLLIKGPYYDRYFDYYEGRHPLIYSSKRLSDLFENIKARFTQNWCAVVIDSVLERIQLQRITVADDEATTKRIAELLEASELTIESNDAHLAALVTGESYIIVWPDEETNEPEAYYNDPRNVHLFYDADKPRRKRFGAKWWVGDDDHRYLTLYYADRLEYYKSIKAVRHFTGGLYSSDEVSNGKSFNLISGAPNEYALVPVFHFRRERRVISSELQNITEPQDAVNKLLSDMMVAAEFGAFKQRYIISNADTSRLKNAPNIIWEVPSAADGEQPVSVGEFDITPLNNYLEAIGSWTTAIAIISRTPKHYFYGQGGDPSGEALIALESPLNHKAQKYIDQFTATWSEIAQFMLQLDGKVIDDNAIVPIFDAPETVQPYTQSLIRKESVAAGIPLMWQMKQEGYTEQELDELEEARSTQQQEQMDTLAATMVERQRQFDQNGATARQNGNGARQNGQPPRGSQNSA